VPIAYVKSLRIQFNDLGRGSPAFLCLPGWCGNKSAFARVTHALAREHRVIALDWRGHGKSDAPGTGFGHDELVDDALAVVRASSVGTVVPVAVSHAGWVALELRARLSERVPRLVLLDWMLEQPPGEFFEVLAALQDRERWLATRGELFRAWLAGCEDAHVVRHVREEMGSYGFELWSRAALAIEGAYAARTPLEALARLASPCPTLHVRSRRDARAQAAEQELARAHPWLRVHALDTRSHFPVLEAPEAVAKAILAFAAEGAPRSGPLARR
jgi:pimeloyl-ACP methyl ester carboxylesterase